MRVALAEDGALFREGLQMLLQAAGHEVVGATADGDALVELLSTERADVAILDIRMPPEPDGGLVTAQRLRAAHPELGLLFLSHYAESHDLMRILQIGTDAIGYRLKEKVGSVDVLSDTLSRIGDGEIVIEPVLAKRLVERPRRDKKGAIATLSEREMDVLRLMAEGRSNLRSRRSSSSRRRPSKSTSPTSSASSTSIPTPPSTVAGCWRCSPMSVRSRTSTTLVVVGQPHSVTAQTRSGRPGSGGGR